MSSADLPHNELLREVMNRVDLESGLSVHRYRLVHYVLLYTEVG